MKRWCIYREECCLHRLDDAEGQSAGRPTAQIDDGVAHLLLLLRFFGEVVVRRVVLGVQGAERGDGRLEFGAQRALEGGRGGALVAVDAALVRCVGIVDGGVVQVGHWEVRVQRLLELHDKRSGKTLKAQRIEK